MREIHLTVDSVDGHPLAATVYEPLRHPIAAVQISSATGVPQRYYRPYAEFLASQGFAVLTYDYRGIGGSRFHGAHPGQLTMHNWGARDYASILQYLHQRYTHLPLLAVGHSVGGQLLGLAPNNHLLTAAIGIAAQSGYWGHWPLRLRPRMIALWYLGIPALLALKGKIPAGIMGDELPAGVAREWARWCRHPDFITNDRGEPLRQHFEGYRGRLRLYAIADDALYAPPAAVTALAAMYRNADVEVRSLRPSDYGLSRIEHFGFFRGTMPKAAWQHTADWLRGAITPQLSRAA